MSTVILGPDGVKYGTPADRAEAEQLYTQLREAHGAKADAYEHEPFDHYARRMEGDGLLFIHNRSGTPEGRYNDYHLYREAMKRGAVVVNRFATPPDPRSKADAEKLLADPQTRAARLTEIEGTARRATAPKE